MIARNRKTGLSIIKIFIKKLRKRIHTSRSLDNIIKGLVFQEIEEKETVPGDVKEGKFVVVASNNEEKDEAIRFVLDLCVLNYPSFLRLLKLAEEEYGFDQKGALSIPCRPDEIRRIFQYKNSKNAKIKKFED